MFRRLELAHSPLTFPGRLVGVFCPVIQSPATAVRNFWNQFRMCRRVARQLIDDEPSSAVPQSLEQFSEEAFGRPGVASALDQDIEHLAFLVDRAP